MNDINMINFILHVSDFHLNDKNNQFARNALKVLANKLKSEGIKIDYLLHTGDVIDSSDLYEMTAAQIPSCKNFRKAKDTESGKGNEQEFDFSRFEKEAEKAEKRKFNKQLEKFTRERFSNAIEIVDEFISNLNISPGSVVICCGNHDVLRPLRISGEEVNCLESEDKIGWEYKSNSEAEAVFEPFEEFLNELQTANSQKRCDVTMPVSQCLLDNLNILLLNTNWKKPKCVKAGYYCARCDQFMDLITKYKQNPTNTLNIVMAHKPLYEVCEKARLSYKRYRKTSFMAGLQEFIGEKGLYVCGDKHTRSIVRSHFHDIPHYIGGEPLTIKNKELDSFEVEYNLVEITKEHSGIERKIHLKSLDGKKWDCTLRPQDAVISNLYDASKGFLTPNVLEMLSLSETLHTWENVCQTVYNWSQDELKFWYTNLHNLYRTICKYRECGNKEKTWAKDNIFKFVCERLSERIENESPRNILNIRGEYNSGKSTFLGLLYIFLLYQYSMGLINFIPAYFNLENQHVLDKIQSGASYHDAAKQVFEDFSKTIHETADREHQPVCYIIDGLDEQDCWSYGSEDSIGRGILDILSLYSASYYIMSFSQHHLPCFKNTMPPRMYNDTSDIIYFNPIAVQNESSTDDRFTAFIDAFIRLNRFNTNRSIAGEQNELKPFKEQYKTIRDFRRLTISPGFMYHNYDYIMAVELHQKSSVDDIYKYYIDRQYEICLKELGYGFVYYAPAMAFLFSYRGYTYENFKRLQLQEDFTLQTDHILGPIYENRNKVYDAFLFIKKQKDASEYLIALHYNRELRYYAEHPELKIEPNSILNDFMTRNIAVLIRKLWSDTNKFVIVYEKMLERDNLSNCLQSMLLYCLAHQKIYPPLRDRLHKKFYQRAGSNISKEGEELNTWEISGSDNDKRLSQFLDLSLKHTMTIFKTIGGNSSINLVCSLIPNRNLCDYNRQYQMLYYGDLSIRSEDKKHPLDPGNDTVYKGFDFHNTFNYLYVKLVSDYDYPLREFDMFTIWDLIRSRLSVKYLKCESAKGDKPNTFFYWDSFHQKAKNVLEQTYQIFVAYLQQHSRRESMKGNKRALTKQENTVITFFTKITNRIQQIIAVYETGPSKIHALTTLLNAFDSEDKKTE